MSINSFPWDSLNVGLGEDGLPIYDRTASASELQAIFAKFFRNGIFADNRDCFRVVAKTGAMGVSVYAGKALINGVFGISNETQELTIEAADTAYPRIDRVVIRRDSSLTKRSVELAVVKGVPAKHPKPPSINRNDSIYDLSIANINVGRNATNVSVVDTRYNPALCGVVSPLMSFDAAGLFATLNEYIESYIATSTSDYEQFMAEYAERFGLFSSNSEKAFSEWFARVQGLLSEDAAGNLQKQIDALSDFYVFDKTLFMPDTAAAVANGTLALK